MSNRLLAWLRRYKPQLILATTIFLTASTSFALGYLANRELNHAPIIIDKCSDM